MTCVECEAVFDANRPVRYCSQHCKEAFAWRKRKAKLKADAEYRNQQNAADTSRRRAAGILPREPVPSCAVVECAESARSLGLCKSHYYRQRRREGKDGSKRVPPTILYAACSSPGRDVKVKPIECRVPVGILPDCPMCSRLMIHVEDGYIFACRSCNVRAEFNQEEVSWLTSQALLPRASLQIAN